MSTSVKIFKSPLDLAEQFAAEIAELIHRDSKNNSAVTIALSGGSTPELLYSILADQYAASVNWNLVHLFWSDERCVPPSHADSNFGMTKRILLDRIKIPAVNIHRIFGENEPVTEAARYSQEIEKCTRSGAGYPEFDLIILGIGEDGHTASIFPDSIDLIKSEKVCEVACHPVSFQKRITLTGKVINNADRVAFLVTGNKKSDIVKKILKKTTERQNFPASLIVPVHGELNWLLDEESSGLLKE